MISDGHDIIHSNDKRKNPFNGVVNGFDTSCSIWGDENECCCDHSSDQSCENN